MNDVGLPPKILPSIRSRFDIVSVTRIRPGMSGASVYRCESRDGKIYALKCWPHPTRRTRIEEVHRVITFSRNSGCDVLPRTYPIDGADTIGSADGFWELMDWMPGVALPVTASLEFAQAGAAAIASFHRAASGLGFVSQTPPAILDRLKRVDELNQCLTVALNIDPTSDVSPRLADALRHAQSILRRHWREAAAVILRSMTPSVNRPMLTQYVLRDIHRDHILFDGNSVSGLIDFDAIRCDTPATDLARWAGSLIAGRNNPDSLWDAVLAGFQAESSLKQHHDTDPLLRLAKQLHFATSWISLANWVVWVLVERRRFPAGEDAVAERILEWSQLSEQEV